MLLLGWAFCQLSLVRDKKLSRWKMGGFGMYSEMHPYKNIIGLQGALSGRDQKSSAQQFLQKQKRSVLLKEIKTIPTAPALLQKIAKQAKREGIELSTLSVYGYDFEPDLLRLSRQLIHRHEY